MDGDEKTGEEDGGAEEGQSGNRDGVRMKDPLTPSEAEVKEHELFHLPYRS